MTVSGGVEIIVLPIGEPDPLAVVAEKPALQVDGSEVTVVVRPLSTPANDPTS